MAKAFFMAAFTLIFLLLSPPATCQAPPPPAASPRSRSCYTPDQLRSLDKASPPLLRRGRGAPVPDGSSSRHPNKNSYCELMGCSFRDQGPYQAIVRLRQQEGGFKGPCDAEVTRPLARKLAGCYPYKLTYYGKFANDGFCNVVVRFEHPDRSQATTDFENTLDCALPQPDGQSIRTVGLPRRLEI